MILNYADKRRWLIAAGIFVCAIFPDRSRGQVPPAAVQQFQDVVGNRVEAVTILGGDYSEGSGLYAIRGGRVANVSVTKFGGGGDVTSPKPLGLWDWQWAPVLLGNLGYISAVNKFNSGLLQGNELRFDTFALQGGAGVSIYPFPHLRFVPAISGIYGYTKNEFNDKNAIGAAVKAAATGQYVDWHVDTWTVMPGLELGYDWNWWRSNFDLSSRYNYFHTESFTSSSPILQISGDSGTWENKISADIPTGLELFCRELHTGGFFSRTELYGGAASGLNADHLYTANARLVFDLKGVIWKMRWFGAGFSYFFANHFSGWSAGADVRFQF